MTTQRSGSVSSKVVGLYVLLAVCVLVALLFILLGIAFAMEYTGETSTYILLFGIGAVFTAGAAISGTMLMKARRVAKLSKS